MATRSPLLSTVGRMTYSEAFDLVDAGQGRWEVRYRDTAMAAARIWRGTDGFELRDWSNRVVATFPSIDDALRRLVTSPAILPR
ncbi:hypothetical protein GCM10027029_14880 [Conyzicola lurida]